VVVSGAAHGKLTNSVIPNGLKYSVIFIIYVQFTNMAAGRIIQPVWPRVGGLCFTDRYRKLYLDNFYLCTVRLDIIKVHHSPTEALFVNLRKL
jgi:hypothetical protein